MALSRDTAAKIVAAVAGDANCCSRMRSPPTPSELQHDPTMVSIMNKRLEETGLAGAFRNAALMFVLSKEELDKINCAGIAAATIKPIIDAISAGKLPEVHSTSTTYRETTVFKIGHVATWINMADGTEYVFDWHATLNPNNPVINRKSFWDSGAQGVGFVTFRGM